MIGACAPARSRRPLPGAPVAAWSPEVLGLGSPLPSEWHTASRPEADRSLASDAETRVRIYVSTCLSAR